MEEEGRSVSTASKSSAEPMAMETAAAGAVEGELASVSADCGGLSPFCLNSARRSPATAASTASSLDPIETMVVAPGARAVKSGLLASHCCQDSVVLFVNAGGRAIKGLELQPWISDDSNYDGGYIMATDEVISEPGDYPALYCSARFGNFRYCFNNLAPGNYLVDLHFAEITFTNGPKGIRQFDVFSQEDKVISGLDIYSVVGGNRPFQVLDIEVAVEADSQLTLAFKGASGIPTVSGICIRRARTFSGNIMSKGHTLCSNCSSEMDVSPAQNRVQSKLIAKFEKKIQELMRQCDLKAEECYEAWSSVAAAREELESLEMKYHRTLDQSETLERNLEMRTDELAKLSKRYHRDKKTWDVALSELARKIKLMKQEQALLSMEAHDCANAIPDMSKMFVAVQSLVAQCEDLKCKYNEEMAKRKILYNQVQEIRGNIRVFCRCRPLSKQEAVSGCTSVVDFEGAQDGDIVITAGGGNRKTFRFDRVFTPKDDQGDVYADASPLVTSVLDGYNVCIFAYGQTGTGKTFTMEGTYQNRGVNYRTLEELFKIAAERKDTVAYTISVSVLEVYNEQIRDLLATSPSTKKLEIRQQPEGSHHVPGMVEAKVENIKEVWDVLQAGSNARAVGSNNVNEHSSRSHCMLCIMVKAKNLLTGDCTKSKLWLVDLAGSERLAKTDAQGDRLKEAQNINKSLSALGDVISALASKSSHIPYRNSKLTHLLQDSLGGDSKALMLVQVSPSDKDISETLSSLNFASRVRGIELGPAKKHVDTAELQKLKQMLEKAKQEARNKDESLRKLEENYQSMENKAKGKEQAYKGLQEKVTELESQLQLKSNSQVVAEKQQDQLSEKLRDKEELCAILQHKLKELECQLQQLHHSDSEITSLRQKVKELESRLRDEGEQKSCAELKIRELEHRLAESRRSESLLQVKVRELETRMQAQTNMLIEPTDAPVITGLTEMTTVTAPDDLPDIEHVLRSSAVINRPSCPGEITTTAKRTLIVGTAEQKYDSHESKRKRDGGRKASLGDQENCFAAPQSTPRMRSLPIESNKIRKTDLLLPRSSNPGRLAAATTTSRAPKVVGSQRKSSLGRSTKEQQQPCGSRTRGWVR